VKSDWQHESPTSSDWQAWLADQGPRFYLFARQHIGSEADAQDLVQDAVVECWQRRAADAPPPPAAVYATIRHRAIDLARSRERRARREQADESPAPCWFDTSAEDRERGRIIQKAMIQLPQMYRDVITLKIWGGLTFAEIATVLGLSAHTAASRYRYGLSELRALVKGVLA
jgi:RNA polymerase sigma-70 factor (ECF subfamily)